MRAIRWSHVVILFLASVASTVCAAQQPTEQRHTVYFLPGTGADERLFDQLDLAPYNAIDIHLPVPERHENMAQYAQRIVDEQIDTTEAFSLVGVSLGGMVATEIAARYNTEATVIIASAKTRHELPPGYRLGHVVPVHKVVGGRTMRWFTKQAQPRFEPMEEAQRELFIQMIYGKPPRFLQRAVGLMVNWEREEAPAGITHVHGTEDHTLPYKFVCADVTVEGEGHMLTYSRPEVVEEVLASVLGQ